MIPNQQLGDTCAMCGKATSDQTQVIVEKIDDMNYTFDNEYCVLVFKKFRSVYGRDFS